MKLESNKQRKIRDRLRGIAWIVVALQASAMVWVLIDTGLDKFSSVVYALLLSVFSVIQMVLILKSSDY
jgi:hypothetical protein